MTRSESLYLPEIRKTAAELARTISGRSREEFWADVVLQDAVVRLLKLIARTASHAPAGFRSRFPSVDWSDVFGLRRVVLHLADERNLELLWTAATVTAPSLDRLVRAIVDGDSPDQEGVRGPMTRVDDPNTLPPDLPIPADDGGSSHLPGSAVPSVPLPATDGTTVDLASLPGRTVVYAYPRTGRPDQDVPAGWNEIPGARGCTPQSCAFRDHHAELTALGARVFGLSTQDTVYQREAVERLHLPFPLLSDADLRLANALALPTFTTDSLPGQTLLRRLTMIVRDGRIEHVFYPVFPPDRNAGDVLAWLAANPA